MPRKLSVTFLTMLLTLVTASCSKEIKPDRKGVWAVSQDKLVELQAGNIDTEFTEEGFAIPFFTGDSPKVREGLFYFILYGDYQVTDLRAFKQGAGRWEIDPEVTGLNTQLETLGMKGEPEMTKARFTKMVRTGVYVLEVRQGGNLMFYPFTVSSGY